MLSEDFSSIIELREQIKLVLSYVQRANVEQEGDCVISGLGIDVTELARIAQAQTRNPHFAAKVLTASELAQWQALAGQRALEYLAGRFSVKESYAKAMGTGLGAVALHAVETLNDASGRPVVTGPFAGTAHVSISHTDELVFTEVILEGSNL